MRRLPNVRIEPWTRTARPERTRGRLTENNCTALQPEPAADDVEKTILPAHNRHTDAALHSVIGVKLHHHQDFIRNPFLGWSSARLEAINTSEAYADTPSRVAAC